MEQTNETQKTINQGTNNMKNLFKVLIAVAAITGVASAYAVPTLTLTASTGGSVTVTDGSGSDSCSDPGCVTFVGTVGIWTLNIDTGLTKPAVTPFEMDLGYDASTRKAAASTMTIDWSDSGFSGTFSATDFVGGTQTAGMTTVDNIYINGVLVFSQGAFTTGSYSQTTPVFLTLTSTDVLTLEIVVTKPSSNGTTSFTDSGSKVVKGSVVPDGGSAVALLGIAMAGIEGLRRLLRTRKA